MQSPVEYCQTQIGSFKDRYRMPDAQKRLAIEWMGSFAGCTAIWLTAQLIVGGMTGHDGSSPKHVDASPAGCATQAYPLAPPYLAGRERSDPSRDGAYNVGSCTNIYNPVTHKVAGFISNWQTFTIICQAATGGRFEVSENNQVGDVQLGPYALWQQEHGAYSAIPVCSRATRQTQPTHAVASLAPSPQP